MKRKYRKYLMKSLVLKMFKLKGHIAQRGAKVTTIVCKLLNYKQKKEILRNTKKLKGSNVFIYDDFCYETMQYRKKLWEEVKNLRSQGKIAYLNYRSIVVVPSKSNKG